MVRSPRRPGPSRRADALARGKNPAKADTGGLRIGVASIDITPPVGILLGGYRERASTSIGHRLRAEALVCEQQGVRWALVVAEALGFPATFVDEVRRDITRRCGIPASHILVTATHTHSAPLSHPETLVPGTREAAYRRTLGERLATVVARAMRRARPGSLEATTCTAPEWGHNRRIRTSDGTWSNAWEDRQGTHTGFFDPTIQLLGVRRDDGSLDALLVTFGCHPVTLGPQSLAISGDYVSYLKDALEEGGLVRTALFGIAGHANINPRICIRRSPIHARRMGRALARRIAAALPTLRPVDPGPLGACLRPWRIPPGPTRRKGTETSVMALRAGGAGIVAVPGELFSEYVAWFQANSPCTPTIVLSFGNDYLGYLPTDAAVQEGAYEVRAAVGVGIEGTLRRTVAAALAGAHRSIRSPGAGGYPTALR